MRRFYKGDKVLCINSKRLSFELGDLRKYGVYTIQDFHPIDGGLILKEIQSPTSGYGAYDSHRFIKLSFFNILN